MIFSKAMRKQYGMQRFQLENMATSSRPQPILRIICFRGRPRQHANHSHSFNEGEIPDQQHALDWRLGERLQASTLLESGNRLARSRMLVRQFGMEMRPCHRFFLSPSSV